MENKEFKILSIDGGGIRGIFPAQFLSEVENQIEIESGERINIYEYFDLICGTSTGGILALALALGFSANDIVNLYIDNANKIFGRRLYSPFRSNLFTPKHSNSFLEDLIKETFNIKYETTPIINDCKTRICIPIYDIYNGKMNIIKTKHHENLFRDWQIPAYKVAMATSAAPTYFKPYNLEYNGFSNQINLERNKVDGGICANNPAMIGLIEAVYGLDIPINNIKILSIGTGTRRFCSPKSNKGWGIIRWMWKSRLIEMFMQAQTDVVENQLKLLSKGIGKSKKEHFYLKRIQHSFTSKKDAIMMNEYRRNKLTNLISAAQIKAKEEGLEVINEFFKDKVELYKPENNG